MLMPNTTLCIYVPPLARLPFKGTRLFRGNTRDQLSRFLLHPLQVFFGRFSPAQWFYNPCKRACGGVLPVARVYFSPLKSVCLYHKARTGSIARRDLLQCGIVKGCFYCGEAGRRLAGMVAEIFRRGCFHFDVSSFSG